MKKTLDEARKEINRIDKEMARLFEERMKCAEAVAEYKKERGLAILDQAREDEIIKNNSALIENEALLEHYIKFQKGLMAISREYQEQIIAEEK
jgi:monofunctional chorismate mutase